MESNNIPFESLKRAQNNVTSSLNYALKRNLPILYMIPFNSESSSQYQNRVMQMVKENPSFFSQYGLWHIALLQKLKQKHLYHSNIILSYQEEEKVSEQLKEIFRLIDKKDFNALDRQIVNISREIGGSFKQYGLDDFSYLRASYLANYLKQNRMYSSNALSNALIEYIDSLTEKKCNQSSLLDIQQDIHKAVEKFIDIEHHYQLLAALEMMKQFAVKYYDKFIKPHQSQIQNLFSSQSWPQLVNLLKNRFLVIQDYERQNSSLGTNSNKSYVASSQQRSQFHFYQNLLLDIFSLDYWEKKQEKQFSEVFQSEYKRFIRIKEQKNGRKKIDKTVSQEQIDCILQDLRMSHYAKIILYLSQSHKLYPQEFKNIIKHKIQNYTQDAEDIANQNANPRITSITYTMQKGQSMTQMSTNPVAYFNIRQSVYNFLLNALDAIWQLQKLKIHYVDFEAKHFIKFTHGYKLIDYDHAYLMRLYQNGQPLQADRNLRNIVRLLLLYRFPNPTQKFNATIQFVFKSCTFGFHNIKKEFLMELKNPHNQRKSSILTRYEKRCFALLDDNWRESNLLQVREMLQNVLKHKQIFTLILLEQQRLQLLKVVMEQLELGNFKQKFKFNYQHLLENFSVKIDAIYKKFKNEKPQILGFEQS